MAATYTNTLQMNMANLMCGMYMCGMIFDVDKVQICDVSEWIEQ